MKKSEIASYLVSLNTLMEAQSKGVSALPSRVLAAEYQLYWEMLKSKIMEDHLETRNGSKPNGSDKDRTGVEGNQPRSSITPGNNTGTGNNVQANDFRPGVESSDGKSN